MNDTPGEPKTWSLYQWGILAGVIFLLHAGLILWLTGRTPAPPRPAFAPPEVSVPAEQFTDIPGAVSPTLFVTPNMRSFSGDAWLKIPPLKHEPAEWHGEPDATLKRPLAPLAAELTNVVRNSLSRPFEVVVRSQPKLNDASIFPSTAAPAGESTFAVGGDLAGRTLVSRPKLESQAADALLPDTVVQIVVDADGVVFAPPAVLPGKTPGPGPADHYAAEIAQSLRFQPLPRSKNGRPLPPAGLTWGTVVFHWRTVPVPATNAPAGPS